MISLGRDFPGAVGSVRLQTVGKKIPALSRNDLNFLSEYYDTRNVGYDASGNQMPERTEPTVAWKSRPKVSHFLVPSQNLQFRRKS